jgi:hypothetical protein
MKEFNHFLVFVAIITVILKLSDYYQLHIGWVFGFGFFFSEINAEIIEPYMLRDKTNGKS